ncbi:MAG: orotate phosphoribosyltransferase [Bacteroidales bacterium]|nr:orotate phosphoribosyltransferase [Bacteroidales bacterium]
MDEKDLCAYSIAKYLLQIKAVKLSPNEPFTWASGWKSPIYCDNRKTLSFPVVRTFIRQEFVKLITEQVGVVDAVAGVATAGIPQGVLVAQDLGLPFVYVRSSQKNHGLENKIEGVVESGQSIVVIEDLISTGGSSLNAVSTLREAGYNVKAMFAIFTYGFPIAEQNFKEAKCPFYTLCNYEKLIQKALEEEYITENDLSLLKQWRLSPETWGV